MKRRPTTRQLASLARRAPRALDRPLASPPSLPDEQVTLPRQAVSTPAHSLSGLSGMMGQATSITVSRSTVVFDGQQTFVEAEEQRYVDGQWDRQRVEAVWEGDRSRDAIQGLTGRPTLRSMK